MSSSRPRRSTHNLAPVVPAPAISGSKRSRPSRGTKVELDPEVDEDAEGEDEDEEVNEEEEVAPTAGPSRKTRPSKRGRTKTADLDQEAEDVGKARRNRKSVSYREIPVEEVDDEGVDDEDGELSDNQDDDEGEDDAGGCLLILNLDIEDKC